MLEVQHWKSIVIDGLNISRLGIKIAGCVGEIFQLFETFLLLQYGAIIDRVGAFAGRAAKRTRIAHQYRTCDLVERVLECVRCVDELGFAIAATKCAHFDPTAHGSLHSRLSNVLTHVDLLASFGQGSFRIVARSSRGRVGRTDGWLFEITTGPGLLMLLLVLSSHGLVNGPTWAIRVGRVEFCRILEGALGELSGR